jgi:excinuclease UvrABC ATPase subunit
MSSQIVDCPECGRRKRKLLAYNGDEICDDCRHYKLINDVLSDDIDEPDVLTVAMEKPVFTNRTASMYVFNSAAMVLHWVWERRTELPNAMDSEQRGINADLIAKFLDSYSDDFYEDVLPVLQEAELVDDTFKENKNTYLTIGRKFDEVEYTLEEDSEDASKTVQSLAGIITSEVLASSKQRSSLEAAFFEAVLDNTVDNDGNSLDSREVKEPTGTIICAECGEKMPAENRDELRDKIIHEHNMSPSEAASSIIDEMEVSGYEVRENELMKLADKYDIRRDRFISKLHECLEQGYLFAAPRSETRTDEDGNRVRYWTIKEEWVKTCAKVKTLAKEHEKGLERQK